MDMDKYVIFVPTRSVDSVLCHALTEAFPDRLNGIVGFLFQPDDSRRTEVKDFNQGLPANWEFLFIKDEAAKELKEKLDKQECQWLLGTRIVIRAHNTSSYSELSSAESAWDFDTLKKACTELVGIALYNRVPTDRNGHTLIPSLIRGDLEGQKAARREWGEAARRAQIIQLFDHLVAGRMVSHIEKGLSEDGSLIEGSGEDMLKLDLNRIGACIPLDLSDLWTKLEAATSISGYATTVDTFIQEKGLI